MGHRVKVFERKPKLGGMLRYGIPAYRLPAEYLDRDINAILSTGVEVQTDCDIGTDITLEQLRQDYDSVYMAIGASKHKGLGIPGEDAKGVLSAIELLDSTIRVEKPDFTGKDVVIIGGGNVAMDATRTSMRLGAKSVRCVYRRRISDMTALMEEIEGAMAEGCEILPLKAPVRVETNEDGTVRGLVVQPQVIGEMDQSSGRPKPYAADVGERRIPADVVIVAVGQGIESAGLEQSGIRIQRGGRLMANPTTQLSEMEGVFAGGDCVTGPATVIRAIAAGKVAAANIDEYLGFHHEITAQVKVPAPRFNDLRPTGRVSNAERDADERKRDFLCIECGLSDEEARQESGRCLRCDHFGYGNFKGGREEKW